MNIYHICSAILIITILTTSSFISPAEAKPLKHSEIIDNLELSYSTNHGILTCVAKSATGGTVGTVILARNFGDGNPLCDVDQSIKKRISVTSRSSGNCSEPFEEGKEFRITVLKIDGIFENLIVKITLEENNLVFTKVSSF